MNPNSDHKEELVRGVFVTGPATMVVNTLPASLVGSKNLVLQDEDECNL